MDDSGERRLVGGLYGVGFDRVFCGESMFSRVADASKVALAWLIAAMRLGGGELLDCQFMTPHLASMGAVEMPQKRYLSLLRQAQSSSQQSSDHSSAAGCEGVETAAGAALGTETGSAGAASAAAVLALPEAFAALLERAVDSGIASSPGKFIAQFLTQTS